jgi:hypothetical protein
MKYAGLTFTQQREPKFNKIQGIEKDSYKMATLQKAKQDDRLLKRLSYHERRKQEQLRNLILNDPAFQFA